MRPIKLLPTVAVLQIAARIPAQQRNRLFHLHRPPFSPCFRFLLLSPPLFGCWACSCRRWLILTPSSLRRDLDFSLLSHPCLSLQAVDPAGYLTSQPHQPCCSLSASHVSPFFYLYAFAAWRCWWRPSYCPTAAAEFCLLSSPFIYRVPYDFWLDIGCSTVELPCVSYHVSMSPLLC